MEHINLAGSETEVGQPQCSCLAAMSNFLLLRLLLLHERQFILNKHFNDVVDEEKQQQQQQEEKGGRRRLTMWQQRRATLPSLAVVKAFRSGARDMDVDESVKLSGQMEKPPFNRSPQSQLQALLYFPPLPDFRSPCVYYASALAAKRRVAHSPSQYAK